MFPLLVSVLVLCLIPAKGYGWFHHPNSLDEDQKKDRLPVFNAEQAIPKITKTYILLPNRRSKEKTPILYPGPAGTEVTAGTVNIDIPFKMLSKTAVFPEITLDRQIAANLRLKNIIDEYLALKERNAQLLKGLDIPYLEKHDATPKNRPGPVPEQIKAEKKVRETMENVIVFSKAPRTAPVNRQEIVSPAALKQDRPRPDQGSADKSVEAAGGRSYRTAYGGNTELPWFFSFALKLIRYAVHNKVEIFLWAAVLIISGLIGLLVVKR